MTASLYLFLLPALLLKLLGRGWEQDGLLNLCHLSLAQDPLLPGRPGGRSQDGLAGSLPPLSLLCLLPKLRQLHPQNKHS